MDSLRLERIDYSRREVVPLNLAVFRLLCRTIEIAERDYLAFHLDTFFSFEDIHLLTFVYVYCPRYYSTFGEIVPSMRDRLKKVQSMRAERIANVLNLPPDADRILSRIKLERTIGETGAVSIVMEDNKEADGA
jgi:hypothetical protein